jgi:spire-like protein
MQVIGELRNGVKLRKVCEKPEMRRHIEYELTPFEILLDQIRARRYHLKKVSMDSSLGPEIKKDARDIILDFIRSRPPLKKSSQRSLKASSKVCSSKSQPVNLHEQLMISIRNYSTPLRHIEEKKSSKNKPPPVDGQEGGEPTRPPKRLIKVDKKLLTNLTSSDDVS